jgi:hypothetical protein
MKLARQLHDPADVVVAPVQMSLQQSAGVKQGLPGSRQAVLPPLLELPVFPPLLELPRFTVTTTLHSAAHAVWAH